MRKIQGLCVGMLVVCAQAAHGAPLSQEDESIVRIGGEGAATELIETGWCSEVEPGLGVAKLSWQPGQEGIEQRVDFTMTRDGFEKGAYSSLEPLKANESTAIWEGIEPGINYYWRIVTLTSEGWIASETARCKGLVCPVDSRPEPNR